LLWTPGYWGWGNGGYAWNGGYWGARSGSTAELITALAITAKVTVGDIGRAAVLLQH